MTNSIYFTKYAEEKFFILNNHGIYFTHEQIEDCIKAPNKLEKNKKYFKAKKDNLAVIYKKEVGIIKILTFFPLKIRR